MRCRPASGPGCSRCRRGSPAPRSCRVHVRRPRSPAGRAGTRTGCGRASCTRRPAHTQVVAGGRLGGRGCLSAPSQRGGSAAASGRRPRGARGRRRSEAHRPPPSAGRIAHARPVARGRGNDEGARRSPRGSARPRRAPPPRHLRPTDPRRRTGSGARPLPADGKTHRGRRRDPPGTAPSDAVEQGQPELTRDNGWRTTGSVAVGAVVLVRRCGSRRTVLESGRDPRQVVVLDHPRTRSARCRSWRPRGRSTSRSTPEVEGSGSHWLSVP